MLVAVLAACGGEAQAPAVSAPAASVVAAPAPASTSPVDRPPAARTVEAVDTVDGKPVADPYRWMEGDHNDELDTWLRAQGDYAARKLARIAGHDKLHARILELGLGTSWDTGPRRVGARTFHWSTPAGTQLARLEVLEDGGSSRVLVDPNKLGPAGSHASVDSFAVSPDAKLLAYNLSLGGGEVASVRVLDVATAKDTGESVDRVWGEFPAVWLPDGKAFLYTQMTERAAGVDPMLKMRVRLHRLGAPAKDDPIVLGGDLDGTWKVDPHEFPRVWVTPVGGWMVASAGGARSEVRIAVARLHDLDASGKGNTKWVAVAGYDDGVESADVRGDRLYLITHKDAPNRRLVSVPLAKPHLAKAKLEIAEPKQGNLTFVTADKDALYVHVLEGGRSKVLRLDAKGGTTTLALPFSGTVDTIATDVRVDGALLEIQGWTEPPRTLAYDPGTQKLSPTPIATKSPADTTRTSAVEVEVASFDGVKVPLSILGAKDAALDGSHPAILYGYGGYGASARPWFSPSVSAWLERGGVYAVCHVRGGGEKGDGWHRDGMRDKKMNGVRDFIACGEWLVAHGYTKPDRLGADGESMGGILVGRAITERPDLFAAAHIAVGLVNPLPEPARRARVARRACGPPGSP